MSLESLHRNIDDIKKNYSKAKQYFVNWYNESDDGNKISISNLKKPYSIVYFAYSNTCEFDYYISESGKNTPYALEMKIDERNKASIKYSAYPI